MTKYPKDNIQGFQNNYSQDLAIVIKSMLQVKPKYRPTCKELLEHTIIKEHLLRLGLDEKNKSFEDDEIPVLEEFIK